MVAAFRTHYTFHPDAALAAYYSSNYVDLTLQTDYRALRHLVVTSSCAVGDDAAAVLRLAYL